MNAIRKSLWTSVLLGLTVGCGGEPEAEQGTAGPTAKANYPGPAGKAPASSKPAPKAEETKKGDEPPAVEGPKAENAKTDGKEIKLTALELAAIKELPPAEQPAAIEQAVCPVSSHHLGSMDKPVKVTAEGRTFYICCESCADKVKSDPKAVIAKLDKK